MYVLTVRNVNEALPRASQLLRDDGDRSDSRNGGVRVYPEPVTTQYLRPTERVLFNPVRDANPFLHLFEALWMLAGHNDLAYIEQFARNMRNYSDDKVTIWGAYGYRWRKHFDFDQVAWAVDRLKKYPTDRRTVISMWDPVADPFMASNGGLDVPCNLQLHLQLSHGGALNMTVFNRSNDVYWGAYGANVVHFSIFQEYMAGALGVPVGTYWQVSDNFHAYDELFDKLAPCADDWDQFLCPYAMKDVAVFPLGVTPNGQMSWDQDLIMFLEEPFAVGFRNAFFRKIATPMYAAFLQWKKNKGEERFTYALEILSQMPEGNDWRLAAEEWITRRYKNWKKAQDDGPNYTS